MRNKSFAEVQATEYHLRLLLFSTAPFITAPLGFYSYFKFVIFVTKFFLFFNLLVCRQKTIDEKLKTVKTFLSTNYCRSIFFCAAYICGTPLAFIGDLNL